MRHPVRVMCSVLMLIGVPMLTARGQGIVRADVDAGLGGVTQFGGNYVDRSVLLARANLGVTLTSGGRITPLVSIGVESLGWDRGYQSDLTLCPPTPDGRCHPTTPYLPSLTGLSALAGVRVQTGARTAIRLAVGAARFRAADGAVRGSPVGSVEGEWSLASHVGFVAEGRVAHLPQLVGSSPTLASYTLGLKIR